MGTALQAPLPSGAVTVGAHPAFGALGPHTRSADNEGPERLPAGGWGLGAGVGLGAAPGGQFVERTVPRPEVETWGLSVGERRAVPGPMAPEVQSGWVTRVPQFQTADGPPEQGALVSLCEASSPSRWGGVWAPCRAVEPVWEASLCGEERLRGSSEIWTPSERKGSPEPQTVREGGDPLGR